MRREGTLRQVVWTSLNTPGIEACRVRRRGEGWRLEGTIVRRFGNRAAVISYLIGVDFGWKTKRVLVRQVLGGGARSMEIAVKGTRWFVQGNEVRQLRGCVDVDLEASPVTNTLPIKRAGPKVGSVLGLTAAWVRFPSLKVQPLNQSYERVAKTRYLYRSQGFKSDIQVDDFGLVRRYGEFWRAL